MPPRLFVAGVVVCWLAAMGWLVADRWLPWLQPEERPPFTYDLADEVAPEHVSWKLYRQAQRAGTAETRMSPRKDGTFEMTSRLRDMDVAMGAVKIKIPFFATTRIVSRDGDLLTLEVKAVMDVKGLDVKGIDFELRIDVTVHGQVVNEEFRGDCVFDSGGDKSSEPLEPIRLVSKSAFTPLQPQHKFPPLRPGQTWRVAKVDPVADVLEAAMRQIISKRVGIAIPSTVQPKELLARVQSQTEAVGAGDKMYTCWVIEYLADRAIAKTWVDVVTGNVIRHEANSTGETLFLQRE